MLSFLKKSMWLFYFYLLFSVNSRIVINEVMANPKGSTGKGKPEDRNEFIELYNRSLDTIDLLGFKITDFDASDSIIPWTDTLILKKYPHSRINTTKLKPNSFALILDPEYTYYNPLDTFNQPYNFPESALILTVGNTTIGDGLANNDPLLLFSPDSAESSSFGTPFNLTDTFPLSAGDGLSWERASPHVEDKKENWLRPIDPNGSTPGYENSIHSYEDLAVLNLYYEEASDLITIFVQVKNLGFRDALDWQVSFYNDKNRNDKEDSDERLGLVSGARLIAQRDTLLSYSSDGISGEIWVEIRNFPQDRNLANNRRKILIVQFQSEEYVQLLNSRFSPDNDNFEDSLLLAYRFPEPNGDLLFGVFDLMGREIRKVTKRRIKEPAGTIFWDGLKNDGSRSPIGIYIIKLRYTTKTRVYEIKRSVALVKSLR